MHNRNNSIKNRLFKPNANTISTIWNNRANTNSKNNGGTNWEEWVNWGQSPTVQIAQNKIVKSIENEHKN